MQPTDLKCFEQVAAVLGEERATVELQRVIDVVTDVRVLRVDTLLVSAFSWLHSPQGGSFWHAINRGVRPSVTRVFNAPCIEHVTVVIGDLEFQHDVQHNAYKWMISEDGTHKPVYQVREELL